MRIEEVTASWMVPRFSASLLRVLGYTLGVAVHHDEGMTNTLQYSSDARQKSLDLKERTVQFAVDVVSVCRTISKTFEGRHVSDQLFRASTSVAANYRAARRARSKKEFIARIGLVLEEADESLFWLEFAMRIKLINDTNAERARNEANQLVAIFYATRNTATQRLANHSGAST